MGRTLISLGVVRIVIGLAIEFGPRLPFRIGPDLAPDPQLPADSRLWAALQNASGGT